MITITSPTRITLALDIIKRLENGSLRGYHELGIVKHQIALADTLTVEHNNAGNNDIIECDDPRVPRDGTNICAKACRLVREKFGVDKYARIGIDKKIPVMGGMAGGSANAAATLKALDQLWELKLTKGQFRELGRELGMDVPFFFSGKTAFDSEATGIIKPIDTDLRFHIVLAIPDFGVSTKEAYGGIDYGRVGKNVLKTSGMVEALKNNDFDAAVDLVHNDFESTVFERYPKLRDIRDDLLKAGCAAACMTGSGSTMVGVARDKITAEQVAAGIDCNKVIVTETLPESNYQPRKNRSPL